MVTDVELWEMLRDIEPGEVWEIVAPTVQIWKGVQVAQYNGPEYYCKQIGYVEPPTGRNPHFKVGASLPLCGIVMASKWRKVSD